jgi:drug/metabolite transporter (DMT)-like permease
MESERKDSMAARPQFPGMRWFLWLRNDALRIGALTGIYLSCTFLAWVLVANHISQLEPFAGLRNLVAGAVMIFWTAIPVLRFRQEPAKMFVSGLTAWTLFTFTYFAAELHYTLLESRMRAPQLFILGAVSYGFVAVFSWVFLMCAEVRHQHIVQNHQTPDTGDRARTR